MRCRHFTIGARDETRPLQRTLRYTVTATDSAHALATFWRKYTRGTFAVDGPFAVESYRRTFPILARTYFANIQ